MRGAVIALALLSHAAIADVVSPAPDSVRVTIYRDPSNPVGRTYGASDGGGQPAGGLVMVSETRTVELPAGTSKVVFLGVADAIVPQTAAIDGLPGTIVESNFDYDLLTPGAVIAKSHGERVRLVRTDRKTGRTTEREAILRTGPQGVMLEIDGKTEALNCSGLDEKLIFPRIPPGLADEPRLSMTVRAASAGRHAVQLSYLALGMDWSADYVARIHPDDRSLDLTGWLTLINRSGTTFANTPAEVVAGQLARDEQETQPPGPTTLMESPACWPIGQFAMLRNERMFKLADAAASPMPMMMRNSSALAVSEVAGRGLVAQLAVMRELGDYKLYAVPEPTTIAARQSKQVQFLSQTDVPFTRLYRFTIDEGALAGNNDFMPWQATALVRLQNKKTEGLGKPLPAGVVSVIEPRGDVPMLAGQDDIKDTPVGLPVELELGRAPDIRIDPRITEDRRIALDSHYGQRVSVEVRLGNDKPVPVTLECRQPIGGKDFRIVSESHSHALKDGTIEWTLRLRPGERAVLRYSMQRSE